MGEGLHVKKRGGGGLCVSPVQMATLHIAGHTPHSDCQKHKVQYLPEAMPCM